jgi:hypothetical protein
MVVKKPRMNFSLTGSFYPADIGESPLREEQKWMDKPLEDAEVACATGKLAKGRVEGHAKLQGVYYKALDKILRRGSSSRRC